MSADTPQEEPHAFWQEWLGAPEPHPRDDWLQKTTLYPKHTPPVSEKAHGVSKDERAIREVAQYIDSKISYCAIDKYGIANVPLPKHSDNDKWQFRQHTHFSQGNSPFHPDIGGTNGLVFWLNADFFDPHRELPADIDRADMENRIDKFCDSLKRVMNLDVLDYKLYIPSESERGDNNRYSGAVVLATTDKNKELLCPTKRPSGVGSANRLPQSVLGYITREQQKARDELSNGKQGADRDRNPLFQGPDRPFKKLPNYDPPSDKAR